jgi:uncharacterized protein YkwD
MLGHTRTLLCLLLPLALACEGVIFDERASLDGSAPTSPASDGSVPDPADDPDDDPADEPSDHPPADVSPPDDEPPSDDPTDDPPQDRPGPTDGVVPDTDHCAPVAGFGAAVTAAEEEVLAIVNRHRAAGASCGERGYFAPTHPLVMKPTLRCAARLHSLDMVERGYFSHTSPEGESPGDRITAAGYGPFRTWGENISRRSANAETMMQGWMNSDGHCANIMNHSFTEIGVGIVSTTGTQKFAAPR